MFCCTLLYVQSSFAIVLMGKRELVALLSLSSGCLVIVVLLFIAMPCVCQQFVIVVFPDHTHCFSLKYGIVPVSNSCPLDLQSETYLQPDTLPTVLCSTILSSLPIMI